MSRRVVVALLVLLLGAAAVSALLVITGRTARSSAGEVELGGPFALVDQNGRPFTDRDLRGRPAAVFFGFTYCPEVCPTTLARHATALKAMGPAAGKLRVVFVTVDPERDTPAQMKAYLSDFSAPITGLTGSPQAVKRMLDAYHVYSRRVPLPGGGYTMDHMAATYMFDRDGRFQGLLGYGEPPEAEVAKLRALAEGRSPSA